MSYEVIFCRINETKRYHQKKTNAKYFKNALLPTAFCWKSSVIYILVGWRPVALLIINSPKLIYILGIMILTSEVFWCFKWKDIQLNYVYMIILFDYSFLSCLNFFYLLYLLENEYSQNFKSPKLTKKDICKMLFFFNSVEQFLS